MQSLLLLGTDCKTLGDVKTGRLGPVTVALSPGSQGDSPALVHKGRSDEPNEDALLVLHEPGRWLFAVADGHHGIEASHAILEDLCEHCRSVPTKLGQIALLLMQLPAWEEGGASGSTLVIASLEEASGKVCGFSFGDSSLATVRGGQLRVWNQHNAEFLRLEGPPPMDQAQPFEFVLQPEEMLLLFTDGVNECCYRDPHRSLQPEHFQRGLAAPEGPAEGLCRQALAGAEPHPGGQDNIAIICFSR